MELSMRMKAISSLVTKGNRLADVGTDHAFIPIYLTLNGWVPHAIAMDIGEGPLSRAIAHIHAYGLETQIETRRSDGLKMLSPEEVDTIIIAGMGGALMCSILDAADSGFCGTKELILQPQSEIFKVRRKLHAMHYQIVEELFFQEDGKYYTVIKAVPGEEYYEKEVYEQYGKLLLLNKDALLFTYLEEKLDKTTQLLEKLTDHNKMIPEKTLERIRQLEGEEKQLKEALFYYNETYID